MLLLDTDYLAYKSSQACEEGIDFGDDVIITQSNFSQVLKVFERELDKIMTAMMDYKKLAVWQGRALQRF